MAQLLWWRSGQSQPRPTVLAARLFSCEAQRRKVKRYRIQPRAAWQSRQTQLNSSVGVEAEVKLTGQLLDLGLNPFGVSSKSLPLAVAPIAIEREVSTAMYWSCLHEQVWRLTDDS